MPDDAAVWKMLAESGAAVAQFKLYRRKGDAVPFRAVIYVEGKEEVREICEAVNALQESWDAEAPNG